MTVLQVLHGFFAIRGQPAVMISENGSQFVGTERELGEMVQGFSQEEIQKNRPKVCKMKKMEKFQKNPKDSPS